jgi:hypothetical protein
MENKELFNDHLEQVWTSKGREELKRRIARGVYAGESKERAVAFLSRKAEEDVTRYLLSPDHSALRAAAAAETANKLMEDANATARSARRIAGFAVLVALIALAAQVFDIKL